MKTAIFLTRLLIQGYRYFISPLLGARCRFEPTCSTYALEALSSHGFIGGCWLSFRRLAKCHPWGGSGYDPVPKTKCANVHQRGDSI